MSFISDLVGNILAAKQLEELQGLRAQMAQGNRTDSQFTTVPYDWDNEEFQAACEAIKVDFFARHPEFVRGSGEFSRVYPDKIKGIETLNRMSELNRIHPDEFLLLIKEIYNF